ncbi:cupin domain-containing protein [Aureimonas psammosilenae]|uniref:hypothetical protein n=1 Tax=Aureimonas psammosilenae TaxID=2495496 RepID=UPI001260D76E|nr:hypothetical protein [Aureimonas psammosilenae]
MTEPQAPKHTALREALQLLYAFAGEGLGCEVGDARTLDAGEVLIALADAHGVKNENDGPMWSQISDRILSAIEISSSSSFRRDRALLVTDQMRGWSEEDWLFLRETISAEDREKLKRIFAAYDAPAIEPDPSSSTQEVRAALTAALRFIRNTDDESGFGTQRMEGDAFYLKAFLLADRIEAALASAPPVRTNAEGDQ